MATYTSNAHSGTNIDDKITQIPNKVNKTGDTMNGNLEFSNKNIWINTQIITDTIPDSTLSSAYLGFMSKDTNPELIGMINTQKSTNGANILRIGARKVINGTNKENVLWIKSHNDGSPEIGVTSPDAWKKGLNIYPIGSIVCMNTNNAPGFGQWELIDKKLKYAYVNSYTPTINTTNTTSASVYGFQHGHNILIAWQWTNKVIMNDDTKEIFTIDPAKFGLTTFGNARNITAMSDNGQVVICYQMSGAGLMKVIDVFARNTSTPNQIAAGTSLMTTTYDLGIYSPSHMLDSACDRFYFKRIA